MQKPYFSILLSGLLLMGAGENVSAASAVDFTSYKWNLINENASWSPRAGLQVVELGKRFYLMGGRTPVDPQIIPVPGASVIWGDVWQSDDMGKSWTLILPSDTEDSWPARAYFQAVTKGDSMYLLGGQNFNIIENPACQFLPPEVPCFPPLVPASDFFNDVWRSQDGVNWTEMTSDAGWEGRAGLSSIVFNDEIYVLGGSVNDDSSIIGEGGPARIYFNDVWKSSDGATWELLNESAPWAPRAGGIVVVKNDYLYLLGGEDGFLCDPERPDRCPPYFNDVWRTRDGADWELVTPAADWVPRPGHQAAVLLNHIVLFGGFGFPVNPMDVWVSKDGANWDQVSSSPWNAVSPDQIKYDFDALAVKGGRGGQRPSIFTFGGDRETFDFMDPTNFMRVDNDVWSFTPTIPKN